MARSLQEVWGRDRNDEMSTERSPGKVCRQMLRPGRVKRRLANYIESEGIGGNDSTRPSNSWDAAVAWAKVQSFSLRLRHDFSRAGWRVPAPDFSPGKRAFKPARTFWSEIEGLKPWCTQSSDQNGFSVCNRTGLCIRARL
jgi:hypothetical protein